MVRPPNTAIRLLKLTLKLNFSIIQKAAARILMGVEVT